jgi:cytochrome c nitrite reductase small subunit
MRFRPLRKMVKDHIRKAQSRCREEEGLPGDRFLPEVWQGTVLLGYGWIMFKRKPKMPAEITTRPKPGGKKPNWLKISVIINIALVVCVAIGLGVMAVVQQSNTNPSFCGVCHIMQANVDSYLNSRHLDNVHAKAGVGCKDCHDYPLQAEISSGIAYISGNYMVNMQGKLFQRKFTNEMCYKCHISYQHVAEMTDFLHRNPHFNHNGELPCSNCHISHGSQIDYCAQCHENGGQRMVDLPVTGRGTLSPKP